MVDKLISSQLELEHNSQRALQREIIVHNWRRQSPYYQGKTSNDWNKECIHVRHKGFTQRLKRS